MGNFEELKERQHKQKRFLKWFGWATVGFLFLVVGPMQQYRETNVAQYLVLAYWLAVIALYYGTRALKNKELRKRAPQREELVSYLDQIAPLPEYDPNLPSGEYEKRRNLAMLHRIRAAIARDERKYGRPLTTGEKKDIEDLLGIHESDFSSSLDSGILDIAGEFVKGASQNLQHMTETIETELRHHFKEQADFFTLRDKRELAMLSAEDRLRRYNEIKVLMEESKGIGQEQESVSVDSEVKPQQEELLREMLGDFPKELEEEQAFHDYESLQRAKIIVQYADDPEEKGRRLRVFNHLALKHREQKGW